MSHSNSFEECSRPLIHTAASAPRDTIDAQWEQLILELRAMGGKQSMACDEFAIARFLSGECSENERLQILETIRQSPELMECIALAQEALGPLESAA
jgi:hypothetical protein